MSPMLLSLEKNFLFIHIPKTAGSSITASLAPYSLPKNRTFIRRITSHLPYREEAANVYLRVHDTALHAQRKLGLARFESLLKFAVVRDPYAHAESYYRFLCQRPNHRRYDATSGVSFLEYLKRREKALRPVDQTSFITDQDGRILVDTILRFESLNVELAALCAKLGISEVNLPKLNSTFGTTTEDQFCTQSRELVNRIYARDFQNFGYRIRHS